MSNEEVSSVGKDVIFEGSIEAQEDIVLEGKISGSIQSQSNITIKAEGYFNGDITAKSIENSGTLKGKASTEFYTLLSGGKHYCNLEAQGVIVEKNSTLNGFLKTTSDINNLQPQTDDE